MVERRTSVPPARSTPWPEEGAVSTALLTSDLISAHRSLAFIHMRHAVEERRVADTARAAALVGAGALLPSGISM
jgi:hypothetical protein